MKVRLLLPLCFVFFALALHAQQFGGFRPSTRWKQINTDTVRVIFTPKSEPHAERVATLLHRMAATENPLGTKLQKINIVLHSNTTLANGYVGLAPFRSEFFLVPGSNIFSFGNLPWSEQLAIHEYRHVQQYNNFNHGISRLAGLFLGQEGRALANAFAVPDWFFEGDAVYAETVLTPQGRGRTPFFFNPFTSLWAEGRQFSWMKLRNGSFRDQVPNHYPLGYLLVNYGYQKYGSDFWRKVTRDAVAFKGLVYPFQQAVKRHSGTPFRTFRKEALAHYRKDLESVREETPPGKTVTNFYFPQLIGKDSLLYLKASYKSLPAFYIRDNRGEHRLRLRHISNEEWLSYRNGTIAYTAYGVHPRWSLTDYSDIVLLDLATGAERQITQGQKYFTPSLSPDDTSLVAVYVNDSLQTELHFLNRQGQFLQKRRAPAGAIFVHPQYIDSTSLVVGIRHANTKVSIHRLDLATMKFEQLLPATLATTGFFYPYNGAVYFTSSLNGADDLYSYRFSDRKVYRLTTGRTGNYYPHVKDSILTWSEFTSMGYRVEQKVLDTTTAVELPIGQWGLEEAPFEVANADSALPLLATPTRDFPSSKYRKGTGLFNFHSWRPLYEDPELSFTLFGNNILNTFSHQLYYRYNQNERSSVAGFNTFYGGWFPMINAGVEHNFGRTIRTHGNRILTVRQTELRTGYSIPLNFTQGKTFKFLTFGSNFVYNQTEPTGATKAILRPFTSTYLHHYVSWLQQLPRARQHIFTRLGYNLSSSVRHRTDKRGYHTISNATLFLPSVFPTHNIVLFGSIQQTDTSNVLFSNRFANSRGYPDRFFSRMWRLSGNYHLPLAYPDRGIPNIVYFQRIRSNLFYDYTLNYSKNKASAFPMRSVGTELSFDTKWWNSLPVTFGFRYSYLMDARNFGVRSPHQFEFVLPVDLIPR